MRILQNSSCINSLCLNRSVKYKNIYLETRFSNYFFSKNSNKDYCALKRFGVQLNILHDKIIFRICNN